MLSVQISKVREDNKKCVVVDRKELPNIDQVFEWLNVQYRTCLTYSERVSIAVKGFVEVLDETSNHTLYITVQDGNI